MTALTSIQRQYILHWGEMGTRWGINRTVAQIHALLYLAPKPLAAEEIAQTLNVARSNVSTSIRELETWGLVRPVHVLGERREHYESLKDVWEMFRIIVEQRKRREVDPTVQLLRRCLAELENEGGRDAYTRQRLQDMAEFFEGATAAYEEVGAVSPQALRGLLKMRGKIRKLLRRGEG
jgi:DNA-binding transcriptional regulator GbsR (MarR family)